MVSFKLAVFLGATTFVTCALAAPVPQGAANVALARRSRTSSDTSDLLGPAGQAGSDSDDVPRSSGSISHGSTHSELSSEDESPTSTLRRPAAPIQPVPVRLTARLIQPVAASLRPIRPLAVRPGEDGSFRLPPVDEAGPSRPPRPDSPRPSTRRPNHSSSSSDKHVLETIPERPPSPRAEDSGEDQEQ